MTFSLFQYIYIWVFICLIYMVLNFRVFNYWLNSTFQHSNNVLKRHVGPKCSCPSTRILQACAEFVQIARWSTQSAGKILALITLRSSVVFSFGFGRFCWYAICKGMRRGCEKARGSRHLTAFPLTQTHFCASKHLFSAWATMRCRLLT